MNNLSPRSGNKKNKYYKKKADDKKKAEKKKAKEKEEAEAANQEEEEIREIAIIKVNKTELKPYSCIGLCKNKPFKFK